MLASAGLLARTLQAFLTQDLGYDPKCVVTAQATWPGGGESSAAHGKGRRGNTAKAFRSLPGVTSASASWGPASSRHGLPQLTVPGPGGSERRMGSYPTLVSSEFFETRRTPLLAGRDFNDGDTGTSPPVAILSEALAKALFGAVNPVGPEISVKTIRTAAGETITSRL